MKIGIIVAMGKELNLLLPLIENHSTITINDIAYHTGKMGNHDITAMQCGIGKVNAAIGTLTLIENFHPDLVINTGVAGGAGNAAGILDVVVAERIAYHDVWCGPGTEWGDAAGCPRFFESVKELTALPCLQGNEKIKHGLICSGDIFISKAEEVERIRSLYTDVLAVDMESASIAQVCYLKNVMFFCMRVISDTPGGDDNIAQYENFWEDAPRHTFDALTQVISSI
ncbi:MAG: 5'-methylthioadenosine/adenosylhomocysteine nucleosidase [Muribaculaceae bacterium]|nr:5'-methylthioadenosine/adenosylhomocysteine nucleosidase [Muribaculaceae bacterium]